MPRLRSTFLVSCLGLLASASLLLPACKTEGCLRGGESCVVPPPCKKVSFVCDDEFLSIKVIEPGDVLPGGLSAMASTGDILLQNSQVSVVIDAIEHPHLLAPSGGTILDIARRGSDNDSINNIFQATGLLPWDTANYDSARLIEGSDGRGKFVALQVRGSLDDTVEVPIYTRYELRPCDVGIRLRTEAVNEGGDDAIWTLTDAFFWGGKENLPFAPAPGTGYNHPSFGLSTVDDVFKDVAFVAATAHTQPASSLATVSCSHKQLSGFHSEFVSAVGAPRRIVPPRDYEIFERFIAVTDGTAVAPVADIALDIRRQLFGEPVARLSGRLVLEGGPQVRLNDEARASLTFFEGSGADSTPWSQAVVAADGRFQLSLPADRDYRVEVSAFGRRVLDHSFRLGGDGTETDLGDLNLPAAGQVNVRVALEGRGVGNGPGWAQVFFRPADQATLDAVNARLHASFSSCAPLLGAPHGPSPACNRMLVQGSAQVQVPVGRYDLYATAGPFVSLARATVDVVAGGVHPVVLGLQRLALLPDGALSGDFHVHGAASRDSSVPDLTRVQAFLAAGIDVIASTDHDTVWDYAAAMASLGAGDRIALMLGTEATGDILYRWVPNETVPKVNGHWNFWPLPFKKDAPYRGAPWDERAEPGLLMTRMQDAGWDPDTGIVQLNHPWDVVEFGRDLGFPRAFALDATKPLLHDAPRKPQGIFHRTPTGARFRNSDYHLQEVMNGTKMARYLTYRAFWFYLLNQGVLRAGTANSDSHGLSDSVLGTPRNIVWTDTSVAAFDSVAFNAALKRGHIVGTNGPVIVARIGQAIPGLAPISPATGARLSIVVSAAPWVPVDEVRVIVNGVVVRTLVDELSQATDPFAGRSADLVRLSASLPLSELIVGGRDSWIVVEAGRALADNADLDCDGVPDTGDNNGDGAIDYKDVDRNDDGVVDARDRPKKRPPACDDTVGPLRQPPLAGLAERDSPRYHFETVVPGGYVSAFTNPFVIDGDADGQFSGGR